MGWRGKRYVKPLKSMPRPELVPEKPPPEKIEVVQQNLQNALLSFFDKIVPLEHCRTEKDLYVFPIHDSIELPVSQVAGSDVADKTGISAQVAGIGDETGFEQLFANPGPRIGSDALDIGKVDPEFSGRTENFFDILMGIIGVTDDKTAHDGNSMLSQQTYGLFRFLPDVPFLKKLEIFR